MADWDLSSSEKQKLKELTSELDISPSEVIDAVTAVKYLQESSDSFVEAAQIHREFLTERLEQFEQALTTLQNQHIPILIEDFTFSSGEPVFGELDVAPQLKIEYDGRNGELLYLEHQVNQECLKEIKEEKATSGTWTEVKVVDITDRWKPILLYKNLEDPSLSSTKQLDSVNDFIFRTKKLDRETFCGKIVGHGATVELMEWLSSMAVSITQELQERFSLERNVGDASGKLLFGYRDEKEAFESGEEPKRYPKTTFRVNHYPETDIATSAVAIEVYDYQTNELLDVYYSDSTVVLSELAGEFLQGAFWLMDKTME